MTDYCVADLVAEFLAEAGISTAFGVASVHNIPLLDAIARRNAIRFVMARGEAGAGHMADGCGRVTGLPGVLISSTGPGAANAVTGLVEARFASTPLLHFTGQSETRFAGRGMGNVHDVPDQHGMLASAGKAAYLISAPGQALGVLMRAAADAMAPPQGPVSIEIPIDIQRSGVARPDPDVFDGYSLPVPAPVVPGEKDIERLCEMTLAAKRPMLWLGAGARHAGKQALRLLEMGFGMATSWAGRGSVPEDHPANLGGLNGNGVQCVEEFYESVDLFIAAGTRLRGHETSDFRLKLPDNLVQIDIDPLARDRTYQSRLFIRADAALALEVLADRVAGQLQLEKGYPGEFRALKKLARADLKESLGKYGGFAGALRAAMPRDAIWVRDITVANSTWGNRLLEVYGPRDSLYPVGAGIGQGLALGIGAAAGAPGRKVVVLTGDGGLQLNLGELWTIAQEKLNITVIVMNDRGYGVIKHIQDASYEGRRLYADLEGPDLGGLAGLAGLPFWKVTRADGFAGAAANAVATQGPALLEVDMTAIGEPPPYFPFGPKAGAER